MRKGEKPALNYTTFLCSVSGKERVKCCETIINYSKNLKIWRQLWPKTKVEKSVWWSNKGSRKIWTQVACKILWDNNFQKA